MKANNILLVGYYDYPYGYSASEVTNNGTFEVELSDLEYRVLYEADGCMFQKETLDFELLKENCKYLEGQYEKWLEILTKLFELYDMIIVCSDGKFSEIKIA